MIQPALARNIGLFALVAYGVGDMVGAGIYGTIGKAAGLMGNLVWLSFIVSMVAAMLTGLSYASLASRYPHAGGASYVTLKAFGNPYLSYLVGLAVAASGLTSMATGSNFIAQNLTEVLGMPVPLLMFLFIGFLSLVNLAGIKESMMMNLLCTLIEVGGLLFIVFVGYKYWGSVDYFETPKGTTMGPVMLMSGAVLTFFAFIGFEDMLNVSEEVKNPQVNMPWGIILAVVISTLIYIAISITAVSVVPYEKLAESASPMKEISNVAAPGLPEWVYWSISMFAVANTALLNYVMGSRLLFGMSRQGLLPKLLGRVNQKRQTPHISILIMGGLVLLLALIGNISQLASATSLLLLTCFCVVNMALVILKMRSDEPKGRFEIPWIIPVLGSLVCASLIGARLLQPGQDMKAVWIALGMLGAISLLYLIVRPKNVVLKDSES